jgi:polyisoprenoid-binding protein YceI
MNGLTIVCSLVVATTWGPHRAAFQGTHVSPRTFRILAGVSQASYAVDEVFLQENNRLFTAVGVSTAISGTIIVEPARPSESRVDEIVVDLRELTSDSDRRDRALREGYLHTDRFPFARLSHGVIAGLPAALPTDRRPFAVAITADLTVHGITRPTSWRGEATIIGDTLRAVARAHVKMSAFGIEVPRLLALRSADDVKLEIRVVAVAGSASLVPSGTRPHQPLQPPPSSPRP